MALNEVLKVFFSKPSKRIRLANGERAINFADKRILETP